MTDEQRQQNNASIGKYLFPVAFGVILAITLAFRLPALDLRPMHGDEANQAVKTGDLLEEGVYQYDPEEHHGPTLYYATLPVLWLMGAETLAESTEVQFRIIPVIFSILMLLLLWLIRDELGHSATLWAGLFFAISHGMVYYNRYFVQETLLICFAFGVIVCGARYLRKPGYGWALGVGIFLGLMHATKETCILLLLAMIGAIAGLLLWQRICGKKVTFPKGLCWRHAAVLILVGGMVSVTLYSSFFTHWRGVLDSVLTFTTYLHRAEGEGSVALHDKPWYYYIALLAYSQREAGPRWTEGLVLGLSVLGMIFVWLPRKTQQCTESNGVLWLPRFLALYTLLLVIGYSTIPYKTPWNLLPFLHGMTLLAGIAVAVLLQRARWRWLQGVLIVLLLCGVGHAARQSLLGNFTYPADTRNPYVYAHTTTAINRMIQRIDDISTLTPEGKSIHINIFKPDGDYWPLPWYLRDYDTVGYWVKPPEVLDAPLIIADPQLQGHLKAQLKDQYFMEFHALRPGILLHLYIRQDLWDAFIASRQ